MDQRATTRSYTPGNPYELLSFHMHRDTTADSMDIN